MAALQGGKDEEQSAAFPSFVSSHPPRQPTCLLPLPQHPPLHPSHHAQRSETKIKHWHRTWHLLWWVGLGFGGRGNNRGVMRGQRWIRHFITWKRQLLPQRLRSKQTRNKLLFLQLTSVRTCSLPPPILSLPYFNSSELLPSCSRFNKWVVLSKWEAKTYWDYSRRERLTCTQRWGMLSGSLGCTLARIWWILFICFAFSHWCRNDEDLSYKAFIAKVDDVS